MPCNGLIFMAKPNLNKAILTSNLSKLQYFWIFQDHKLTKLHVQQSNTWFLKIYQPIYIDHYYTLQWVDFYGTKASQHCNLRAKLKQISVFAKLVLDRN